MDNGHFLGICATCGRFQTDKKFKRSDKRDNAAWNLVLCDTCRKRGEKMPKTIPAWRLSIPCNLADKVIVDHK